MKRRPCNFAASSVEPEPQNGSRTTSPRREKDWTSGVKDAEGFLRRMQPVTGVLPFEHIGNPLRWLRRIARREQVCVLVVVAQKPLCSKDTVS